MRGTAQPNRLRLGFYLKLGFVPGETLLRNDRHGTRMTWRANA